MYRLITCALTALLLIVASDTTAGTYVSLRGKFYVTYPESWKQLDYTTIDVFLMQHDAGESVMDYDAAFADSTAIPFFKGSYIILTVDTVQLSNWQIDSLLESMKQTYGADVRYFPVGDLAGHMETNKPSYDREKKVITVLSDVKSGDELIKKHAQMMKFYGGGIANFYCFAPDSLFETALPVFQQIVNSLSTENVEAMIPKEELKVADLDGRKLNKVSDDSEPKSRLPLYSGGVVVIILIAILARKKRAAKK